jgi:hypothetical protein
MLRPCSRCGVFHSRDVACFVIGQTARASWNVSSLVTDRTYLGIREDAGWTRCSRSDCRREHAEHHEGAGAMLCPVTPETQADSAIHEHLDWLTNQQYIGVEQRKAIRAGIQHCVAALVPDGQRVVAVWWDARKKVAAAINVRRAKERP